MLQRLLILISGLLFGSLVAGAPTWQTFTEWRTACAALPTYRALVQAGVITPGVYTAKQNYQYSAFKPSGSGSRQRGLATVNTKAKFTPFDASELESVMQAFLQQSAQGVLADPANWVDQQLPPADFYNPHKCYFKSRSVAFMPFVQKLVLTPNSRVVIRGDLHGDIHSLLAQLTELQRLGYLDRQDGFKLAQPQFYLLFLGDYTDRGIYGAEVLYTILRLKLANPDQVFMVRGNHEDIKIAQTNGFSAELAAKFGVHHFHELYRLYDYLPVALYLGCQHDFLLCCHGGLEVGYQPQALLGSPGKIKFALLGDLNQLAFLKQVSELAHFKLGYANYTPDAPVSINGLALGFMWNDFLVSDRYAAPLDRYNASRGHAYNERATQLILRAQSDSKNTLCGVLRAHQHTANPEDPMMQGLLQSRGVYKLWRALPAPDDVVRSLIDGLVWTFNVAPDSVYGIACDFSFDSFAILRLGRRYQHWSLQVINPVVASAVTPS